ncbi:MAG TPA: carbonic anhydrase [Mycobacteriales bacterium]|jgi:Carbonic anhydrase
MSATEKLLANAEQYATGFTDRGLSAPPATGVAVVTCMDARVNPYAILGLAEGDAHVIRNAGGVVTADVRRSLVISQRLLGTTEIVLIHHSGCGMTSFTDSQFADDIERETGIRPDWAAEAFADIAGDVRQSIARLKADPLLPHTDAIRGFVFDVTTGALTEVN